MATKSRFMDEVSSSEPESDVESIEAPIKKVQKVYNYDSSSDEDQGERKVIPEKDRRLEALKNASKNLVNTVNSKDFDKSLDNYNKLHQEMKKAAKLIEVESHNQLPKFVLNAFYLLNDKIESSWTDRKQMKKPQQKGIQTLRTKFRNYRESTENDIFRKQFEAYEPEAQISKSSSESESESEDHEVVKPTVNTQFLMNRINKNKGKLAPIAKTNKFMPNLSDEESDSSDESSDESSSESSSDGDSDAASSSSDSDTDSESDSSSSSAGDSSDGDSDHDSEDWDMSSDDSDKEEAEVAFGSWRQFLKEGYGDAKYEENRLNALRQKREEEKAIARRKQEAAIAAKELEKQKLAVTKPGEEGWEEVQDLVKGVSAFQGAVHTKEGKINLWGPDMLKAMGVKEIDLTEKQVLEKYNELRSMRGKRNYDKTSMIKGLEDMIRLCDQNGFNAAMKLKFYLEWISTNLEFSTEFKQTLKSQWQELLDGVETMLKLAQKHHKEIRVDMLVDDEEQCLITQIDEETNENTPLAFADSIVNSIDRIEDEYTKILQNTDQHSLEYKHVLMHEKKFTAILKSLTIYQECLAKKYASVKDQEVVLLNKESTVQAYNLLIKHYHFRFDNSPEIFREMKKMCEYIYNCETSDRINYMRMQTVLYQIYYDALHDRWHDARDLFLMTHMTQMIEEARDVETKILYHRAVAQLGLAGFRRGEMHHAHDCLSDLQSTGRVRELLAQGLSNPYGKVERTPEEEAIQKRRILPFHMHINLELLECSYHVSAMIKDIPNLAQHEFKDRVHGRISRSFYRLLQQSERNTMTPDSYKESIMIGAKAMKLGNWKTCVNAILSEKLQKSVWNRFPGEHKVVEMLTEKLKKECLRTYMFTYSQFYNTISKEVLAKHFELPVEIVNKTVTKLILESNLQASWDDRTGSVILHGNEPSRLQNIALQLSQKIGQIQEQNEKISAGEKGMSVFGRMNQNYGGEKKFYNKKFQQNRGDRDGQGPNKGGHGQKGDYGKKNYNKNRKDYRNNNSNNNNNQKSQSVRFEE